MTNSFIKNALFFYNSNSREYFYSVTTVVENESSSGETTNYTKTSNYSDTRASITKEMINYALFGEEITTGEQTTKDDIADTLNSFRLGITIIYSDTTKLYYYFGTYIDNADEGYVIGSGNNIDTFSGTTTDSATIAQAIYDLVSN